MFNNSLEAKSFENFYKKDDINSSIELDGDEEAVLKFVEGNESLLTSIKRKQIALLKRSDDITDEM